jgi:hypothetical protein
MKERSQSTRLVVFLAVVCALQAVAIPAAPHANPHDPAGGLAWLFGVVTLWATAPLLWSIWKPATLAGASPATKYALVALSAVLLFLDAGFVITLVAR